MPTGVYQRPAKVACSLCDAPALARGWCKKHYSAWYRTGDPLGFTPRGSRKPLVERTCSVEGCEKRHYGRGYCSAHHSRWKRHGDPLAGQRPKGLALECESDGCREQQRAQGLCQAHYKEWWKAQRKPCSVDGCDTPADSRGLCPRHYQRLMKFGAPTAGPAFRRRRGEGLPRWAYWQRRDEQRQAADADLLSYVSILHGDPCVYCGGPCEHIDHIVPVNSGGMLEVENVTASCARCNARKSSTPLLHFLRMRHAK